MKKQFKTSELKLELREMNAQIAILLRKQDQQIQLSQRKWWYSMAWQLMRLLLILLLL